LTALVGFIPIFQSDTIRPESLRLTFKLPAVNKLSEDKLSIVGILLGADGQASDIPHKKNVNVSSFFHDIG
jgi:hypothetical protein